VAVVPLVRCNGGRVLDVDTEVVDLWRYRREIRAAPTPLTGTRADSYEQGDVAVDGRRSLGRGHGTAAQR
jgi:hypothetical protein